MRLIVFLSALMAIMVPVVVFAEWLACNPQANTNSFVVKFDGVEEAPVPYKETILDNGTVVCLLKDLTGIRGTHTVQVKAINQNGDSPYAPVFEFTLAAPDAPTGSKLDAPTGFQVVE